MPEAFRRHYRAPGRVNLIGEHTDYNLGHVLPVALDLACVVTHTPTESGQLHVFSELHNEGRAWPISAIPDLQPQKHWTDYVIGVAQQLIQHGLEVAPAELIIRSTVPEGAGLSSSAALEVAVALALIGDHPLDRIEIARICQRAEIEFVGMPCGIMDQFVSLFGQDRAAILLDCRNLTCKTVPLPPGMELLAVNTMVKHELASSAYRERTKQCAVAIELLGRQLRDVTLDQFEALAPRLPEPILRRARHVISENARVLQFVEAASRGDLTQMGRLFVESHRSLQYDYEVSCAELDFLVDTALAVEGVLGARMTGGGFGGCTVNLLRTGAAPAFREIVSLKYQERFGIRPQIHRCQPSSGAGEIKISERTPAGR